ncbi:PilW family protein [Ottowia sp. VDI28]|uniref:PilW family protein n=1 Tax=Ottowia sp. VDI28 TaxID=3133968 RepID=UPI003C2CBFE5
MTAPAVAYTMEPIHVHLSPSMPLRGARHPSRQRGVTLIELMVGLAVGLLVIAVAMGALIVSRGVSGTVSDASEIQQQGAYVLRVIGGQLRQAGSLRLNPDPGGNGTGGEVLSAVAFEVRATAEGSGNGFEPKDALSGDGGKVTTGAMRYADNVFMAAGKAATEDKPAELGTDYLARNCLGLPGKDSTDKRIESTFTLSGTSLRCEGNQGASNTAQPIAQNVAQFEVSYLVQGLPDVLGTSMQYRAGSDMPVAGDAMWRRVQGVQVCLVLFGTEPVDMPAGSSYTDCNGESVDITKLEGARHNRMHLLFRNTFQVRSQGLL